MNEQDKVVEGETVDATNSQIPETDNWEEKYKTLQAENDKLEAEKENYRKGLLKAKGYLPNDVQTDDTTPDIEEVVKKVISETLLDEKSRTSKEEERKLVESIIQENKRLKELNVSLANRSQISSATSSSGSGSKADSDTKKHGWTDEQEKNLRNKGIDPIKAWNNFKTLKEGS